MKRSYLIVLMSSIFFFTACEKEQSIQSNSEEEILLRNSDEISLERDILEAQMQWVSFTISGILLEDDQNVFRNQFQAISESEDRTIFLSELLEDEVFSDRFSLLSEFYFLDDTDIDAGNATRPTNKPPKPPVGIPSDEVQYTFFIDAVQEFDCIEVYLPNILDFEADPLKILSSAHPLTNDDDNTAYLNHIKQNEREAVLNVDITKVMNDFGDQNIILVRPISSRNTTTLSSCDYSQFEVNEFSEFLDGE